MIIDPDNGYGYSTHILSDPRKGGAQLKLETMYGCINGKVWASHAIGVHEIIHYNVFTDQFTPENLRQLADKIEREMQEYERMKI